MSLIQYSTEKAGVTHGEVELYPKIIKAYRYAHKLSLCNRFSSFCVAIGDMAAVVPIGVLTLSKKAHDGVIHATSEQIYGGYANGRGQICLFGKNLAYRVNFKFNTVQQAPPLNSGAQARYDATEAGETFEYCRATFRRLDNAQIIDICSSGSFRLTIGAI